MKISPMTSTQSAVTTDPGTPSQQTAVRSLKMTTMATPLQAAPPADAGAHVPAPDPNLSTSPTSEGTATDDATQPLSPQLAAIARQRRDVQRREQELKAREDALKAQPVQTDSSYLARIKAEPLAVLQEAGVTYQQLTEHILAQQNGVSPEQYRALQAKVEALESGLDDKLKARDAEQEKAAIAEMTREAQSLVGTGDEFELIRETRAIPTVMRLIEKTYRQTGDVLDVNEACRLVEAELVKDMARVAGLGKIKSQLGMTGTEAAPPAQQRTQAAPAMRTLSNRDATQAPMTAKQRAMAAFWGQPVKR